LSRVHCESANLSPFQRQDEHPQTEFVRVVARIDDPQFVSGQVAGHRARRLIDAPDAAFADPFVLMAEDWTPQGIFPFHPHRGIGSSANRSVRNGEIPMSIEKNIQTVKDFFAAIGRGDKEALLALVAEDIEWIIPGEDWPLAGTRHGHAGLAELLETASKSIETSTEPKEFVAEGDRVLVVGFARGRIKATNKTFEDDWVFAITVRDGRLTNIREYVDTQALARASQMDASGRA
jgi:ketosteroid isomerase-like protein